MKKYITLALSMLLLSACTVPTKTPTTTTPTASITSQVLIPSPTHGTGKHKLMIFADFQCPACRAFSKLVAPTLENYADRGFLEITYKQFPLTSIHPNAEGDAVAALCSAEQGKYMEYKKALYVLEDEKNMAKVTDADRINAAKGILDEAKITECLKTQKYLPQVRAELAEGDALGVEGTPTVFLDGKKLDSAIYRDPSVLKTVMDRLLEVPTNASGSTK